MDLVPPHCKLGWDGLTRLGRDRHEHGPGCLISTGACASHICGCRARCEDQVMSWSLIFP